MIVLRSFLSNLSVYAIIALGCILAVPLLLFPESVILKHIQLVAKLSSSISLRLAGIDLEIKGQDNIPKGAIIVASKHESLWETQFLLGFFDNVSIVLKKELFYIPILGLNFKKAGYVFVDRNRGKYEALRFIKQAKKVISKSRPVVIFPQGSRITPGEKAPYKSGVAILYKYLKVPCVPVALNSGKVWPRRKFFRYPGKIVVEFLDPIYDYQEDHEKFLLILEEKIETATKNLLSL